MTNLCRFKIETKMDKKVLRNNYRMYKKTGIWAIFHVFRPEIFFFKNDPIRANFLRGIDCAHFRSLKTLMTQGIGVCIEAKIKKF
jgi:hypothetical protein